MIAFFDVESDGLPLNWKAPIVDVDNWPRVIQLAWTVTDFDGNVLIQKEVLIQPNGWEVPTGQFWIDHGFNTAKSMEEGVPISEVLTEFLKDMEDCQFLVSHNMDFDFKVVGAEMIRLGMKSEHVLKKICTKETSTSFCKIPFSGKMDKRPWIQQKYKWPKLSELHIKLFGKDFEDAHSAGGDVLALKNCFFELLRLGVIKLDIKPE